MRLGHAMVQRSDGGELRSRERRIEQHEQVIVAGVVDEVAHGERTSEIHADDTPTEGTLELIGEHANHSGDLRCGHANNLAEVYVWAPPRYWRRPHRL